MSALFFRIFVSGFLGCVSATVIAFGIGCLIKGDDWMDKILGILMILFAVFIGFFIVLVWCTGIRGLE